MKKLFLLLAGFTLLATCEPILAQTVPAAPPLNAGYINPTLQNAMNRIQPYKKIITNITQSSTSAPVDTVISGQDNEVTSHTLGRYSAGYYWLFCSGCFDLYGSDATQVYISQNVDTCFISAKVVTVDSLNIRTFNAAKILIDGVLNKTPLELRMIP